MCINIEAEVTPAIDPTQSCSWHGEKEISRGRQFSRLVEIFRQPFEHQRPGDRAFHRAAHFFPVIGGPA